ncbi:MAG TPA: hypothetical protein VG406_06260 [Isosphaeraceae bacterium]|jgi:hypothetical protein|nr:hypothetical protein [Isosphaeraceae bacterium]
MISTSSIPAALLLLKDWQAVAAIDIRNSPLLTPEFATEFRHAVGNDGSRYSFPFYLLVSQEHGYLWDKATLGQPDAPPTIDLPMATILKNYSRADDPDRRLSSEAMFWRIFRWLLDLTLERRESLKDVAPSATLTAFLRAVEGGIVQPGEA